MSVVIILMLASLTVGLLFVGAFVWSVRSGQYEDTLTPSMRVLLDDAAAPAQAPAAARAAAPAAPATTRSGTAKPTIRGEANSGAAGLAARRVKEREK
jgi:cbb3-type cytochrome oxidase maturation protein